MRKTANFSKPAARRDVRRYVHMLNDPEAFARQAGVTDPEIRRYLHALSAAERQRVLRRKEVAQRARELLRASLHSPVEDPDLFTRAGSAREEARLLRQFAEWQASVSTLFDRVQVMGAFFPKGTTLRHLTRLERRAQKILDRALPSGRQLAGVRDRLLVCPLCGHVFLRARNKRAQRYCPACRRRWTKQQLWYRARTRTGGNAHEEATRTR